MTILEVSTAIDAQRAITPRVFGVKLNPQDFIDLVRELPTATDPAVTAVLAVTAGVRTFLINGSRVVPRPAVPVGTMTIVSAPGDV